MKKLVCGLILALFVSSAAFAAANVKYYGGGGGGGGAGINYTGQGGGLGGAGGAGNDNKGGDGSGGGGAGYGGGGGAAVDANYTGGGSPAAGAAGSGGRAGSGGTSNIAVSNDGTPGADPTLTGEGGNGGYGGAFSGANDDSTVGAVTLIAGSGGGAAEPGMGRGGSGGGGGGVALTLDNATAGGDITVTAGAGGNTTSSPDAGRGGAGGNATLIFGSAITNALFGDIFVSAGQGGDKLSGGAGSATAGNAGEANIYAMSTSLTAGNLTIIAGNGGDGSSDSRTGGYAFFGVKNLTLSAAKRIEVKSGQDGSGGAVGGKAEFTVDDTLIAPSLTVTKQGGDVLVYVTSLDVTRMDTVLTANGTSFNEFMVTNVALGGGRKLTVSGAIWVGRVTMASGTAGRLAPVGANLELTSLTVQSGSTLTLDLSNSTATPPVSVSGIATGSVNLDGATVNVTGITTAPTTDVTLISSSSTITGALAGGSLRIGNANYLAYISDDKLMLSSRPTLIPPADPDSGRNTPQSLTSLLSDLNKKIFPQKVSALEMSQLVKDMILSGGVKNPAEVTLALPADAMFLADYALDLFGSEQDNILPSFSSTIKLGGNTTGNVLALSINMNLSGVAGFDKWGTLSNSDRMALLETTGVIIAYEFPASLSALVGKDALLTWSMALESGIVTFDENGLVFRYAVTDSVGDPYEAGDMIVIPDGNPDGKIVDPVWLLQRQTAVTPTAVALTPDSLTLKRGASGTIKAAFTPTDASERDLVWTVSPSGIASVSKAAAADTWTVTALAEGAATLSAAVSADRTIGGTASLLVVESEDDEQSGGSSGCQGPAPGPMMLMALFAMLCAAPLAGKKR